MRRTKYTFKEPEVFHEHHTLAFPRGFLWGTAISAHQVEGYNQQNDWWEWERLRGKIRKGQVSGRACDHYNRYKDDFKLARSLNLNAQRISLEWSRLQPAAGEWDAREIEHYRTVLETIRKLGMKTMVTLNHYTLPIWFTAAGGWFNPRAVDLFSAFVTRAAREYHSLIDFWLTINEPLVYVIQSYVTGAWPPGTRSTAKAWFVFRRLAHAHRAAYAAIHRAAPAARVGSAHNVSSFEAYSSSSLQQQIAEWLADRVWNQSWYSHTVRQHDFLGLNYYLHLRIHSMAQARKALFGQAAREEREVSDLGWEIHAPGIFEILTDMEAYQKPIYITENGVASADDTKRPRFLVNSLKEVYHAIKAGIDVRGYFYWSLMDNFEWEKGFGPRFGLVHVDYSTLKRTLRPSAAIYARMAKANGIPHDLLKFIGHTIRP